MSKTGRRIKSRPPMDDVAVFIMPNKNGASNKFRTSVNINKCDQMIKRLRAEEDMKGLGLMHVFMAAYLRVVAQYPGLNRYIQGQRVYARKGVEICLTIKKELQLNAQETVIKLDATPADTLQVVYENLNKLIEENKQEGDQNSMDKFVRWFTKIPRVLLKFIVWFLKTLDYYGLLPRALTKLSPFHGSLFITNLGSLGIEPVFHHLYDFGNLPLFVAMGGKRVEYTLNKDGETERNLMFDFTLVCDERICDGHYFATALKKFKRIMENPEQLLTPPETVVEDIK